MDNRFLTPTLHGVVDYLAAASLLTLPFALGETQAIAKWLAVGTGAAVVVVSLLTALSEQIRLLCQNVGTGFRGH